MFNAMAQALALSIAQGGACRQPLLVGILEPVNWNAWHIDKTLLFRPYLTVNGNLCFLIMDFPWLFTCIISNGLPALLY